MSRSKRDPGRKPPAARRGRAWVGVVALAGLGLLVALVALRSSAAAPPSRAAELEGLAAASGGETRRLIAIEELRRLDTSESRAALERLADSANDHVAVPALGAICRDDYSGARRKLALVARNTGRSDVARAAALAAWCTLEEGSGRTWKDVKTFVRDAAGTNERLVEARQALKAKYWADEEDD